MKKMMIALLLALVAGCTPRQGPPSRYQVPEGVQVTRMSVTVADAGSGILVRAKNGTPCVLTAWHVLSDRPNPLAPVVVRFKDPGFVRKAQARVRTWEASTDLALLALEEEPGLPVAEWPDPFDVPDPGSPIWYCGYGSSIHWNLIHSEVNQATRKQTVVNGEAWYGHSGSGVISFRKGKPVLVGVILGPVGGTEAAPRAPTGCAGVAAIREILERLW